jgi:hypothetical protein
MGAAKAYNGTTLQSWSTAVKDKDGLDAVKEQFIYPSQETCSRDSLS